MQAVHVLRNCFILTNQISLKLEFSISLFCYVNATAFVICRLLFQQMLARKEESVAKYQEMLKEAREVK